MERSTSGGGRSGIFLEMSIMEGKGGIGSSGICSISSWNCIHAI